MKLFNYYKQRHSLFSLYDSGICLDDESWYSVTPEVIARNIAQKVHFHLQFLNRPLKILDLFCCAGGDTIAHAISGAYVTAVDIDNLKLDLLKHNSQIYNVYDHITCICANAKEVVNNLHQKQFDVILIAPPWGGPRNDRGKQSLDEIFEGLTLLWTHCVKLCNNTVLYIPKDVDISRLLSEVDFPVECIDYFVDDRKKMNVLFTGLLIDLPSI
ncbi:Trimethylguanosine synthase [Entamoeba marina]